MLLLLMMMVVLSVGLLCVHEGNTKMIQVYPALSTIQIDCVINYGLYKRYRGHYSIHRPVLLSFCYIAYYVYDEN